MIELRVRGHVPVGEIAAILHRNHSVVCYELKRNRDRDGTYKAVVAQILADKRRKKARPKKLEDEALKEYVISQIKEDWSPEQIAGRLKKHPPPHLEGRTVSHETIYQWMYEGAGRWENLWSHLRQGKKKRQRHFARKARKIHIPERISIHLRPKEIEGRKEVGHWESDSMIFSKQKPRLSVQTERKTMYMKIHRLANGSAEETERAIAQSIESFSQPIWQTITFDNGGEGAGHQNLQKIFGLQTFFCDPYASWQKGSVENQNGLIRQYLPRSTDMCQITDYDIHLIEERLNNRPRKTLGYQTPKETLGQEVVHC